MTTSTGALASDAVALPAQAPAAKKTRDLAIDLVRGLAMLLMALDHARDFLGDGQNPTDLSHTTPFLFFTRWITHFCAPVFIFLAGVAVSLSAAGGKPKRAIARFLVTRGLWLVLLEITVVRLGWTFDPLYRSTPLQVIWAIGWSMVALAALVHLPRAAVVAIGAAMVLFHNFADGVHASLFGESGWIWSTLHEPHFDYHPLAGARVSVVYPLIPWIGVMALGYGAGAWVLRADRRALFVRAGMAATLLFLVLRASRLYGDPRPWTVQPSMAMTIASFLDCTKYPPSLLYLAMTLGPAMILIGATSSSPSHPGARGRFAELLATIGRVPLFYYVAHLFLLHALASSFLAVREGAHAFTDHDFFGRGGAGFSLPLIYASWLVVVAALYPACRWFAGVKARRRDAWLSYL